MQFNYVCSDLAVTISKFSGLKVKYDRACPVNRTPSLPPSEAPSIMHSIYLENQNIKKRHPPAGGFTLLQLCTCKRI